VTHARGACSLRVEVLDTEAALPRTDTTETLSGLQLVDLLPPRWGVEPAPGGTVLWFEFDLESSLA
jgi:hypothetical protein